MIRVWPHAVAIAIAWCSVGCTDLLVGRLPRGIGTGLGSRTTTRPSAPETHQWWWRRRMAEACAVGATATALLCTGLKQQRAQQQQQQQQQTRPRGGRQIDGSGDGSEDDKSTGVVGATLTTQYLIIGVSQAALASLQRIRRVHACVLMMSRDSRTCLLRSCDCVCVPAAD